VEKLLRLCFLILLAAVSGCAPAPTAIPTPTATLLPVPYSIPTSLGQFGVSRARLVDEANSTKANPGEKILLVTLTLDGKNPDSGSIPLDQFSALTHDSASGEQVHVTGSDGVDAISTMGGWVDGEFVMGFNVPANGADFVFHWPGLEPMDLTGLMK
jgi:hypothetical protein